MKKRILLTLLFLCALFLLVGCATTKATDVFRFEVRELKLTLYADVNNNKEKQLKLIRGDTDKNATIVYTVSYIQGENAGTIDMDNGIVQVKGSGTNDKGYVTTTGVDDVVKLIPLKEGTVRFTAFVQGKENVGDSIIVTVEKEIMSGFQLIANNSEVYVNETGSFTTKTIPSYLDNSVLRYEVSDETIATINEAGTLKGLKPGTVTVKAYSKYDPTLCATTSVKILYADAGSITVYDTDDEMQEEINLANGASIDVYAEVKAKQTGVKMNSVNQNVTYESSDTKVFNVTKNEDGTATILATGGGSAKLTVTSDDKKANQTVDINVTWGVTEELCLESTTLSVKKDKTVEVKRTEIKPANANPNFKLDYKSDDDKEIILINSDGTIKGLKPGEAYVVVSSIESGQEVEPKVAEIKVTVSYDDLVAIKVVGDGFNVVENSSSFVENEINTKLVWSYNPTGINPELIKVESSDETIAKIDKEGNLKVFNKVGTAVITISSTQNPEIKAEYNVKVAEAPEDFSYSGVNDGDIFTYSEGLEVIIVVKIEPENALQDAFDVEIENKGDCFVDFETEGNNIILIFDAEALGEFDVIITVPGVQKEEVISLKVVAPAASE